MPVSVLSISGNDGDFSFNNVNEIYFSSEMQKKIGKISLLASWI